MNEEDERIVKVFADLYNSFRESAMEYHRKADEVRDLVKESYGVDIANDRSVN